MLYMVTKEKDRNNVSAFETKGPGLILHATGLTVEENE